MTQNDPLQLKNSKAEGDKKTANRKSGITPTKRQSILTANVLGDLTAKEISQTSSKMKFKKPNLEINLQAEKIQTADSNSLIVNEDNINEIFDQDYEEKIEANLLKVWESAQVNIRQELEKTEEEMTHFLDNLADEKFRKTMEINNKFEGELKEFQADDLDLNDESNVNTIIYNELIREREKEMADAYKEIDEKKKKGLQDLRNKSAMIKNNYEKMNHISKVKSEIAQGIKSKIIKSLTPKETLNKKFDFNNVNYNNSSSKTTLLIFII